MSDFYNETPDKTLRFGDVISGFQIAVPQANDPCPIKHNDWIIKVSRPSYAVVMTPCCSIENESVSLAPLFNIRPAFLKNDFFKEDLTRINDVVPGEHSVSSHVWKHSLPPERQQALLSQKPSYVSVECFIYASHDLLEEYVLNTKEHGKVNLKHYMVDFKTIYRVECDKIKRDRDAPKGIKLLELTVQTRQLLRNKLVQYYSREADEDRLLMNP